MSPLFVLGTQSRTRPVSVSVQTVEGDQNHENNKKEINRMKNKKNETEEALKKNEMGNPSMQSCCYKREKLKVLSGDPIQGYQNRTSVFGEENHNIPAKKEK